jgi:cell fate regulator YaaT (PSP1 superfamily)
LPQFEADLAEHLKDEADRLAYERLNAPKTLVIRFGYLKMVGEFPWQSNEKPGCGSKIVVRTHRGTEIGEMLTSTCPNSGCSKSVSRKEMLEYIENSGGRQYPFSTDGRALRIATPDDMQRQTEVEQSKHALRTIAKRHAEEMMLPLKIVEAEPILGGERITVYFLSEDRVDFRDLVQRLQNEYGVRVDMRQVGARDEARITADYERCGQYCCCKNFLKVLKPISMKSAKTQKATLDPLKISGRCGRLMCCLRYEDETYEDLRKRLPHRKSRVGTPDGDGTVIDSQILTQLVLVRLDSGTDVAVPVENLTEPGLARAPEPTTTATPAGRDRPRPGPRDRTDRTDRPDRAEKIERATPSRPPVSTDEPADIDTIAGDQPSESPAGPRKKRRRRKRKPGAESAAQPGNQTGNQTGVPSDADATDVAEPLIRQASTPARAG